MSKSWQHFWTIIGVEAAALAPVTPYEAVRRVPVGDIFAMLYCYKLTEPARPHQLVEDRKERGIAKYMADGQASRATPGSFQHPRAVFEGVGYGFLQQDIVAPFQCGDGRKGVMAVGGGDHTNLRHLGIQHLRPVGKSPGGRDGVFLAEAVASVLVRVGYGHKAQSVLMEGCIGAVYVPASLPGAEKDRLVYHRLDRTAGGRALLTRCLCQVFMDSPSGPATISRISSCNRPLVARPVPEW